MEIYKVVLDQEGAATPSLPPSRLPNHKNMVMLAGATVLAPVTGGAVALVTGAKAGWELFSRQRKGLREYEALSVSEAIRRFPGTGHAPPGFFTVHPMVPNTLVPLEGLHTKLMNEKDAEFVSLMRVMGATAISISRHRLKAHEARLGGKEASTSTRASVGLGFGSDAKTEISYVLEGKDCDFPDDLLERSIWFQADPILKAIFDGRKQERYSSLVPSKLLPNRKRKNRINHCTYESTYESRFHLNFDLALEVAEIDLESDYERVATVKHTFTVAFV